MTMKTMRMLIREELKTILDETQWFVEVHKDKWTPTMTTAFPACRIEVVRETCERLSDAGKTARQADVEVHLYVDDLGGQGEAGEIVTAAVDDLLALLPTLGGLVESFELSDIQFDAGEEADLEIVHAVLTYSATWNWTPDPPEYGPLKIVHADIDCAVGDPPGPDGRIEASTTIDLEKV